jgi:hypothetical protein
MLVCDGTDSASVRRFRMKVTCCQVGLFLLLLISGSGTNAVAYGFPGSCLYGASPTGDLGCWDPVDVASETIDGMRKPFIQLCNPGIIQSASAYGRGLTNLKMRVTLRIGHNPVPMYILMFWVEWACWFRLISLSHGQGHDPALITVHDSISVNHREESPHLAPG